MLNKLKLAPKLIGGFLIVAMITMVIGIMGISNIGKMNAVTDKMYEGHLLGISHAKEANINLISIEEDILNLFLASTTTEREKCERAIETYNKAFKNELQEVKKSTFKEEGKMIIQKVETEYEKYLSSLKDLINTIKKQDALKSDNSLMDKLAEVQEKGDNADNAMAELAEYKLEEARKCTKKVQLFTITYDFSS